MFDFIKDHAIKNVWCTPDQDTQLIIEPAKLTPLDGAITDFKVMWRKVFLPDPTSYWHVYQIGQVHPLILGLFPKINTWTSFAETCNLQKMICDIYTVNGIQLPRVDTFYMYNNDKDLIVAVRKNINIPFDFINDKIYIRVYSNEFFNSNYSDIINDKVYVEGIKAKNVNDILTLQTNFIYYSSLPGLTYAFVNGYKVNSLNLLTMDIGDVGEFVYDSSVKKVIDFKINDLGTFESTLDNKVKYLLHYLSNDVSYIDYQDDIDFFIIDKFNATLERGVYFHKNKEDSVRMLTHRDYSITVPYVLGYTNILQLKAVAGRVIDPENLIIRLHVRKSSYQRPIIFEHNRIKELYKMPDENVLRALLGIDSVVDNWKASVLEESYYTEIMRSKYTEVSNEMVQYGYGYNSISKIIGDTPSKTYTSSFRQVVDVPYGLQNNSTAYEYDVNGNLLEYNYHLTGSIYAANNPNTRLVEIISGKGSNFLNDIFGNNNVPIPANSSYKVYTCKQFSGIRDNIWKDVTDTDSYIVENGLIKWVNQNEDPYIRVRSNDYFLCYDLNLQASVGTLKFSLVNAELRDDGLKNYVMQVPMGELDIFLNGKSLIKNLDYFVNFPEVVIVNKEYLINPLTEFQNIHIRFTGFCDKDLQLTKANDVGFIEHGFLSNNKIFDIRDDKVLRIIVDGQLKHKDDLQFSEEHSGVSILNPENGKPYLIRDIIVPLLGLTNEDTYTLRDKSLIVDKTISEYLTLKIPQPPRPDVSAITARYQIFSPFICKIIYDLNIGELSDNRLLNNYSDNTVLEICKPYENLLAFDPITEGNNVDSNFVIIHPHNLFTVIELDLFCYRFIQKVVKLYCKGLVDLSSFIRLKPIN